MRLSRANIPLASEDRTHSQAIYTSPHNNLAPHFLPGFINLQHFRHSRWRNPVRLSKMGLSVTPVEIRDSPKGGDYQRCGSRGFDELVDACRSLVADEDRRQAIAFQI